MREKVVLICPTAQAKKSAADWHDGQIGWDAHAGFASQNNGLLKTIGVNSNLAEGVSFTICAERL